MMPNDEYYTPKWLFDQLAIEFDLDVASANNNWIVTPAKRRFTIQDNGLDQTWYGNIWMNPPYSKVTPWIEKFMEHGNGVCLIPALSSNGKWVNKLWNSDAVCSLLPANMKFVCPNGDLANIRFRTALWAMGKNNIEALKNANFGRVR